MNRFIHRNDLLVFLLLLGTFAWFQHAQPGWNVNSRFALALALAETASPRVDDYLALPELHTQDLAQYNGHLYSDKSIGTSLLAVPAVWTVNILQALTATTFTIPTQLYLVTLLSVGLLAALTGVLLMRWLALIWNLNPATSPAPALIAIGIMLGTMLHLYATLLMSYIPATACLLAALIAIEHALRSRRPLTVAIAGLFAGLAILCEYTYAAAAGLMGLYMLWRTWQTTTPATTARNALLYGTTCAIGILPFILYSYAIFGRPTVPYQHHLVPEFRTAMATGFMGANWPPSPTVLWLITFHPFRGIFIYSPALLLGLTGLIIQTRHNHTRPLAILALATTLFYLLFNAAYYMWWGGWSFSPRHLAPAIPFLAAGLHPWLAAPTRRTILATTLLIGITIHTLVNATEPQPPDGGWQTALLKPSLTTHNYPSILTHQTLPRLKNNHLEPNLATQTGLPPTPITLLPLPIWWLLLTLPLRPKKP